MGLTPEELREVLARAEEIQSSSRHGREMSVELELVISAAEEVGLARSAVERALRASRNRVYLTLMGTGAAIGAVLGVMATFLLLR
jgi:hypothetical protein